MASPEAAQRKLDLQVRRARLHAERYGTPEQVERLQAKMNQPTLGDTTLAQAFTLEAVNDLMEQISGNTVPEEELMEEEKIYGSDAEGNTEEWQPSHLTPADEGSQGKISDELAEAINKGDAEGQVAGEETQNLPEDENKEDPASSTSDQERKKAGRNK